MTNKLPKKIYLAGDMLNRGAQLQRAEERDILKDLGHELYVPQDNKDINDKKTAVQEGLSERIVAADTAGILWSDTVVIEPLSHALGTNVELGQILGMFDLANEINDIYKSTNSVDVVYLGVASLINKVINRKIYPHYEDVRRVEGITETGDRRTLGLNAYMYGACLKLTNGKGIYEWDEIITELSK